MFWRRSVCERSLIVAVVHHDSFYRRLVDAVYRMARWNLQYLFVHVRRVEAISACKHVNESLNGSQDIFPSLKWVCDAGYYPITTDFII